MSRPFLHDLCQLTSALCSDWPILVSILSKSYHIFHSPGLEVSLAKLCQYLYFVVVVVRPQERQRRSVQPWCEPARCTALPPRTWTPSRSAQQCCFVTSHLAPLARSPYKSSTWTKCSQALSSTSQRSLKFTHTYKEYMTASIL